MSHTPRTDALMEDALAVSLLIRHGENTSPKQSVLRKMFDSHADLERENRRLREALKATTQFVQPSLHVRNADAMEVLEAARDLLRELGEL